MDIIKSRRGLWLEDAIPAHWLMVLKTAWYNWRSRLVGRALQPLETTSPKGFIPNGLAWDAFDWVVENNMVRSSWWILFCIILTTHAMLFPRFALASGLLDISKTLPQYIFVMRDAGSHVSIMWGFLCLQTLHSQPPGISLPVNMLLRMSVSWAASGSSILNKDRKVTFMNNLECWASWESTTFPSNEQVDR